MEGLPMQSEHRLPRLLVRHVAVCVTVKLDRSGWDSSSKGGFTLGWAYTASFRTEELYVLQAHTYFHSQLDSRPWAYNTYSTVIVMQTCSDSLTHSHSEYWFIHPPVHRHLFLSGVHQDKEKNPIATRTRTCVLDHGRRCSIVDWTIWLNVPGPAV